MTRKELCRMLDDDFVDHPIHALPNQPCTCGRIGYCPQHGTYEPPQIEDGREVVVLTRTRRGERRLATYLEEVGVGQA